MSQHSSKQTLSRRSGMTQNPRMLLTLICSCSWASCCRDSCSCCRWNSAMRICRWICCFCFSARSSCCSCCSRSAGSKGSENWWSRRRSIGTAAGATCRGSAVATSTMKRVQQRREWVTEAARLALGSGSLLPCKA